MASFFTRFRRDKSKERQDPKKRYSVPVFSSSVDADPDFQNNTNFEAPDSPALKSPEDRTRSPKNERTSNHDNKKSAKKEDKPRAKKGNPLSYLLCMSGNADTIDRQKVTGLPPHPNKAKSRGKNTNPNESAKVKESTNKENKKSTKNKKPPKGWFSTENIVPPEFLVSSEPTRENIYGPMYQPTRGPSQGVRYRVDGTLEKPYVFPSGFTFGPEGRKLRLRQSTPDYKSTKSRSEMKLENVHVDIHLPSTASDEFEPDKDFNLKFDSPRQSSRRNVYRYSMPEVPGAQSYFPSNIDFTDHSRSNTSHSQSRESSSSNILNSDNSAKKLNENKSRSSSRRSRHTKNRYSMPPKNDEFVYMGSFENLHLCDSLEKRQNAENERLMKEELKKEKKRNRYSMPPKNPDCVYMGSFENLTFQFSGDRGVDPVLSLPKKDASLSRSYSSSASSKRRVDMEDNRNTSNHEMVTFKKKPNIEEKHSARNSDHNAKPKVDHKEHVSDAEEDAFDENLPISKPNFSNPFSRNAGRSSCMPGNKRSFAPPAAIFDPVDPPGPKSIKGPVRSSVEEPSDGKSFKLPPPPNHTPSWEEMEKVQVRLSEIARGCHKGSQADISSDAESINMEDRDKSLGRVKVKRLSSVSPTPASGLPTDKSNAKKEVIYDVPKPTVTLQNPTSLETIRNMHPNNATSPRLNKSNSSDDSVFESPKKVVDVKKPNIETHSANKNSPYINVKINNADRNNQVPKARNDYEYMYLSSTPQVSLAAEPRLQPVQKSDSMRLDNGYTVMAPQTSITGSGGEDSAETLRKAAVMTSTPKVVRRLTLTEKDSGASNTKPVPSPRKRSGGNRDSVAAEDKLLTVVHIGDVDHSGTKPSPVSSSTQQTRTAPVPKKRTNLSYSSSACSHSEAEKKFKVFSSDLNTPKGNNHQDERTGSVSKTVPRNSIAHSTDDTKHIYEDVVINKLPETKVPVDSKLSHYEVCGSLTKPGTDGHNSFYLRTDMQPSRRKESALLTLLPLSPVHTLKLTSSPLCKRRSEGSENWTRPIYTGLSTSASDLAEVASPRDHDYSNWIMSAASCFDDDDTCVADDELSACNEEDYEDVDAVTKVKRGSMRKWASADDIIRSGSIIDRSMILAKRRRLRKRHKKSQPASSTDAPGGKPQQPPFRNTGASDDNNNSNRGANNVFVKNKKPASASARGGKHVGGGDRHRLNHTDSGHDSDIISPCASPLAIVESYVGDVEEPCPRRQASASRKSWEVRLQNLQWQRKIRSRENLSESLV